jgi:hypothetical protein
VSRIAAAQQVPREALGMLKSEEQMILRWLAFEPCVDIFFLLFALRSLFEAIAIFRIFARPGVFFLWNFRDIRQSLSANQ